MDLAPYACAKRDVFAVFLRVRVGLGRLFRSFFGGGGDIAMGSLEADETDAL